MVLYPVTLEASLIGDEIDPQTEGRGVSEAILLQPERKQVAPPSTPQISLFTAHLSGSVTLRTLELGGTLIP